MRGTLSTRAYCQSHTASALAHLKLVEFTVVRPWGGWVEVGVAHKEDKAGRGLPALLGLLTSAPHALPDTRSLSWEGQASAPQSGQCLIPEFHHAG